jgi:hypothetical protein
MLHLYSCGFFAGPQPDGHARNAMWRFKLHFPSARQPTTGRASHHCRPLVPRGLELRALRPSGIQLGWSFQHSCDAYSGARCSVCFWHDINMLASRVTVVYFPELSFKNSPCLSSSPFSIPFCHADRRHCSIFGFKQNFARYHIWNSFRVWCWRRGCQSHLYCSAGTRCCQLRNSAGVNGCSTGRRRRVIPCLW